MAGRSRPGVRSAGGMVVSQTKRGRICRDSKSEERHGVDVREKWRSRPPSTLNKKEEKGGGQRPPSALLGENKRRRPLASRGNCVSRNAPGGAQRICDRRRK